MWTCPRCGRAFANRNQSHSCGLADLEGHFQGGEPRVRETFDRLLDAVREIGPVTVLPERTRIALQVRMSFVALMPRRGWLDGHVVLARRRDSPGFGRAEPHPPRNVSPPFWLLARGEVNHEVRSWLAEAYEVGARRHLVRGPAEVTPPLPAPPGTG